MALERLDETRLVRRAQIGPDRLHTRGSFDIKPARGKVFEAQHRPVDIGLFAVIVECDCTHHLAGLGNGNDGVRRAEVDANRSPVPHRWSRHSATSPRSAHRHYSPALRS